MTRAIRTILLLSSFFLVLSFAVFVINQTDQLVALADRFHPLGGDVAFWSLLVLYVMCLAVPTVLLLRLPRSLKVPADDSGTEFDRHLDELKQRLRRNDHVSAQPLDTRADIEAALKVLGDRADEVIQQTARQVFITTAVSQNGSLDSVVVLAAQSKMTWTLARLYYQRPSLRELTCLYGNVAATAFVAAEIEDLDLAGQLEPVMSSVLGSFAGAVPGLQVVSAVAANSIFNGSANAFMTLRVGLIAKQYCEALVRPDQRLAKRSATAGAALMLGGVVANGAKRVAGAFVGASTRSVATAARSVTDAAKSTARDVGGMVKSAGTMVARPFKRGDDEEEAVDP